MPLIRGANLTYSAGNDDTLGLATDGVSFYAPTATSPARVVKSLIATLTETATATLTKDSALGIAVLGGFAFTSHAGLAITTPNAGLVVKTDTSSMLEVASTQLWSPGVGSQRQTVAIYSDGTWLYVGSNAYDPGGGYLNTAVAQMDSSFGSLTETILTTKGSTTVPSSIDSDGTHVYFAIGRGPTPDTTDSVVQLSISGFAEVAKWALPAGTNVTDVLCIPPKLYVGTTQGVVYRLSTSNMSLDGPAITLGAGEGGAGAMAVFGNLLVVATTGNAGATNSNILLYNLSTLERVGGIALLPSNTGPGATTGIFGPNTQGTVQYWGTVGGSPGQIQELRNVWCGAKLTYPTSKQTTWFGGGPGQGVNYPATSRPIAAKTSNVSYGAGVSTQISSSNPILQASMMGDPHFYGFEGESWFFNGEPGGFYNLFSDEGIQINSLFRYWETSGGNNFTAMEEIGITIAINKIPKKNNKKKLFSKQMGELIKIKITANEGIAINGEYVCDSFDPIIEFIEDPKTYFTDKEIDKFNRTEGYGVFLKAQIIRFWPYHFIITKSTDGVNAPYLNIIARLDGDSATRPHGVIGQTADYDKKPKDHWDGEDADYKVADLWSNDFKFNKFKGA